MIYYRIPNWADYQQYKDRDPSWIKLHKRILNNRAYMELPLEAKGLLPMMWILASESSQPREGIIEIDDDDIAFRLRVKKDVLLKNIAILVSACFITDVRSRTELYTEKRREETETYREETEKEERKTKKIGLSDLSVEHIKDWLLEKRLEGRYINHDEFFVLEQFKQYCLANGKKYADYIRAYQNAFEWGKCQPKQQRAVDPASNAHAKAQSIIARRTAAWQNAGGKESTYDAT